MFFFKIYIMKTIQKMSVVLIGLFCAGFVHASAGSLEMVTAKDSFVTSACHVNALIKSNDLSKEYDFSKLSIGQFTEIIGYDSRGNQFTYRVTRVRSGIEIAVKTETLQHVDGSTTIVFKGPNGIVKTVRLGEIAGQRCGWLCVLAHVCCIKIHLGPPGNTWEWDCDCVGNED
jgi:hypothetical protein